MPVIKQLDGWYEVYKAGQKPGSRDGWSMLSGDGRDHRVIEERLSPKSVAMYGKPFLVIKSKRF